MRKRRLKHASLPFALDEALTPTEASLYKAAHAAAYGEFRAHAEPREPSAVAEQYLAAIEAFRRRRPTAGYDHIERGNHRALLRLGRSKRRGGRDPRRHACRDCIGIHTHENLGRAALRGRKSSRDDVARFARLPGPVKEYLHLSHDGHTPRSALREAWRDLTPAQRRMVERELSR